jgi:HAD superfamily hydrolase (TIGR01549 family)
MALPDARDIRAIVFDLDGTLYVCEEYAATIQEAAAGYVAALLGVSAVEARRLIAASRLSLAEVNGSAAQTLSAACCALGGTAPALHDYFQAHLHPESFLNRDDRVVELVDSLGRGYALYIYTNNNRPLSERIIRILGLEDRFEAIFSIDETWQAKPDGIRLEQILKATGLTPVEVLFVGDRYEVDLRLPEQRGCPVYLSRKVDELLLLEELIDVRTGLKRSYSECSEY